MTEEKILLQVSSMEEGTAVKLNMTKDDIPAVSLALFDIYTRYPELLEYVQAICLMAMMDKDFEKKKKAGTIEMPDFDKLLKNIK